MSGWTFYDAAGRIRRVGSPGPTGPTGGTGGTGGSGGTGSQGNPGIDGLDGAPGHAGTGYSSYYFQSDVPATAISSKRFYTDRAGTITWCRAGVLNGDGTTDATLDVRKNGTSIYPTSTKPSVVAGQYLGAECAPDTMVFAKGDYFQVDISATGSTAGRIVLTINFGYALGG